MSELLDEVHMEASQAIAKNDPYTNSRHCPVLQDIDGNIACILSHSGGQSLEATIGDLINATSLQELQQTRIVVLTRLYG